MQKIIDPNRTVPIVLDADMQDEKPITFWVKMIGPIEHARMQGIASLRVDTAVAAGSKRNDPEVWEKTKEAEVGYLATRCERIDNWPTSKTERTTVEGSDEIALCLRCLSASRYHELLRKATGEDELNDLEGKVSVLPS